MTQHAQPDNLVCLARARNAQEAHIWRQALEVEGITSKVVGDFLDASIGNISGTLPELWVHEDDLDKARRILSKHTTLEPLDEGAK